MVRLKNVLRYGCYFITRGYFGIAVLICLLPYLFGAAYYNLYCQNMIQDRILTLEGIAYEITPLLSYDVGKFKVTPSKSLISRDIEATVLARENPDFTYERFMRYFVDNGWENIENNVKNKRMTFKNDQYVFSLCLGDKERQNIPGAYKWVIYLQFNDFFSKYNL